MAFQVEELITKASSVVDAAKRDETHHAVAEMKNLEVAS
jgi:hypothetical protein